MASEKQIAANRANATRSTGPKTAAGKLKSSRNAYRHGLSGPRTLDRAVSTKVDAIARVLAGEQETGDRLTSATNFARAKLELLRIRKLRSEWLENIDCTYNSLHELRRLVALDRYERYALTKRRRASLRL
jgi:hypothetical protein